MNATPTVEGAGKLRLVLPMFVVVAVTICSRIMYWPSSIIGKDGELYINSMKLDETYNVPPPGNVGWVLLGKLFTAIGLSPLDAFTLAGIAVSAVGIAFLFLLSALFLRPWMAAVTTLAAALSPLVWYHASALCSYETWIAVPPAIVYFGVRYWRERRIHFLYASALATGIGTILRPDMVAFSGPLLGAILLVGRAPLIRGWFVCGLICLACCFIWFVTTATAVGGVEEYIHRVRAKSAWMETWGASERGVVEGLARNGGKFALFAFWGGLFVAPFAVYGFLCLLRSIRTTWRGALLGLLAVLPTMYFGIWIFMGNAGLVLPFLVAAFLLAGFGLERTWVDRNNRPPLYIMSLIGILGAGQFMLVPLLKPTDQRDLIFNVTFSKYSGHGIREGYNYNLADFGIDPSFKNSVHQFLHPEPVPVLQNSSFDDSHSP